MSHIYKITNLINNKIYIGKSLHPDENYFGSGLQITAAIEKYGRDNFRKDILENCTPDNLDEREIFWIEHLNARDTNIGYNISIGGTGGNHYWKSLDEVGKQGLRDKISIAKTGATINYTDTQRTNVRAALGRLWDVRKNDTEWLKSRAEKSLKSYLVIKDSSIIRVVGLKKFCKENKLDLGQMSQLANGTRFKSVSGYYCLFDENQTESVIFNLITELKRKDKEVHNDWLLKTQTRPRYTCDHCGISVTKSNLTRWHNMNCKQNGKDNIKDIR